MPHYNVGAIDSALFSDGFGLAPHHNAEWTKETKRIREVRGEVLSAMFAVEGSVDHAIANLILPHRRSFRIARRAVDRHLLLQNHVLTHFDLRTKIEILGSLLEARFPKKKAAVKAVCSKLDAVRDVRNKIAHCPVYFEALKRKSHGHWLRPHLMTVRGTVHLSDGYIRAFKRDALEAAHLLGDVMRKGPRVRPSVTL
jgi:hypothetical protein